VMNPWGVTEGEAQALEAVIEEGSVKGAARVLGLTVRAVEKRLTRARERMGLSYSGHFRHLILWDRHQRGAL
jgi:hypothetical protein